MEFIGYLIAALPVVGALAVVASANVRRSIRVRQSLMPAAAALYAIAALILLYRFNDPIQSAITAFTEWAPFLPIPISTMDFDIYENALALLVFAGVKAALQPLFAYLFHKHRAVGEVIVSRVYEYASQYDLWFIERRFGNLRSFLRVLYLSSAALALVFIALNGYFPSWPGFASIAYPALAAMVIGECYFAIDGLTRLEYDRDILGEEDRARRVANYGPLRRVLRETFPGRVLSDSVHVTSSAALDSQMQVDELARQHDDARRMAGKYFQRLGEGRKDVDVNLVDASVGLLEGSSVLINNPFYSDLTPYLSLPAYYKLLQYRKCLIVAGRDSVAEDLVGWIAGGLEDISGVPDLWVTELLTPLGRDGLDVGVLRFADLHNLELLRANDEFLKSVEYIILAEPSRMMATGQLGLGLLMQRCARGTHPVFAAFDGTSDGLVDSLSHLLKLPVAEVVASALPFGASSEVVWQAEGPHMHAEILPSISRYLGQGTEIAAVAMKYQIPRIHWVGADAFPVRDILWIDGQYYSQINAFADKELSQDSLSESLIPVTNPGQLAQEDNYFLIVEDESSNAFEAIRRFATRARDMGFVNLISEDYLLRDYMVGNRDLFSADPKAIPAIVPDFARTERNAVLRLLLALTTFEVSHSDLVREFQLSGWSVPTPVGQGSDPADADLSPVVAHLRDAVIKHTALTEVSVRAVKRPGGGTYGDEIETYYSVEGGPGLEAVVDSLRAAYFFVEDERKNVNHIGSLLFGHVHQALLPGQFVTYAGRYYEVERISTDDYGHGVVLRRAADHIRDRRAYRQLRGIQLSALRPSDAVGSTVHVGDVGIVRSVADITVDSFGYLDLPSRSDLVAGRRVTISDLPQRRYPNKSVLELRLPEIESRARKTICLLLNEVFVTVFPHAYQYVVAVTADPEGEFEDLLDPLSMDDDSDSIFIVEDSMIDLGLLLAVERNWQRLLEIIADYLAWNASPPPEEEDATEFVVDFPPRPIEPPAPTWFERMLRLARSLFGGPRSDTLAPEQSEEEQADEQK